MAPPQDIVLVDIERLSPSTVEHVRAACRNARVTALDFPRAEPEASPPLLVVSALPAGERRVPEALVEVVTRAFPGVPLLLLAAEPLVRRVMSLQGGRINLLAPPHSPSSLTRRINALLADRRTGPVRAETLPMGVRPLHDKVISIENERVQWWSATLLCRGDTREAGPMVSLRQHVDRGVTVIVPFGSASAVAAEDDVDRALTSVRGEGSALRVEKALAAAVGEAAGVIHLSPGAEEWTIYWPRPDATLTLSSPTRLPASWDLGESLLGSAARARCMRAVSGDLLTGLSASLPAELGGAAPDDGAEAGISAGQAALRRVEARLRAAPRPLAGMIMEVL